MKFTEEQFREIEDGAIFCCDDISMDWDNPQVRLNVFNSLPQEEQGLAVQWGVSDTVFRDEVFVHLVKTLYGLSTDEYYARFKELFTEENKTKNTKKYL
jgi:hypothetical protein